MRLLLQRVSRARVTVTDPAPDATSAPATPADPTPSATSPLPAPPSLLYPLSSTLSPPPLPPSLSPPAAVPPRVTGEIGPGLLLFLGIHGEDTPADGAWLAQKVAALRLFADDTGRLHRSLLDLPDHGVLVVSQFTLYASTAKGTRPSFNAAARPEHARPLYETFIGQLRTALAGRPVATGEFGAMMAVELVNDGPVTLLLDSRTRD